LGGLLLPPLFFISRKAECWSSMSRMSCHSESAGLLTLPQSATRIAIIRLCAEASWGDGKGEVECLAWGGVIPCNAVTGSGEMPVQDPTATPVARANDVPPWPSRDAGGQVLVAAIDLQLIHRSRSLKTAPEPATDTNLSSLSACALLIPSPSLSTNTREHLHLIFFRHSPCPKDCLPRVQKADHTLPQTDPRP